MLFIVWALGLGILQNRTIQAGEITQRGITLIHVSPEFVRRVPQSWGIEDFKEAFDAEHVDEFYRPPPGGPASRWQDGGTSGEA